MTGTTPDDDTALANTPDAPGGPPNVSDRVAPGAPPPASNQAKDEPTSTADDVIGATDTVASTDPQSPHAVPRDADHQSASEVADGAPGMTPAEARPGVDLGSGRGGAARPIRHEGGRDASRTAPGPPPQSVERGTGASGNAQGVSVPATESAPGTSQQSHIVEGVRSSPGAVAGSSDGEVDTDS